MVIPSPLPCNAFSPATSALNLKFKSTMSIESPVYAAGTRIRVTQQTPLRDRTWVQPVEGEVVRFRQATTGSWFAHSRDDRLWLDRLELRLDDGELAVLNLDQYSVIEAL